MEISAIQPASFIDFPGKISLIVFSPGCNYQCPSCHARILRDIETDYRTQRKQLFDYLDKKKSWIDGIVLCGGEPTLQTGLEDFIQELKSKELAVKLDTNGSNPQILKNLTSKGLVDYVAMDIKAPKNLYPIVTGTKKNYSQEVEESMKILTDSGVNYEFRTTLFPINDPQGIRWFNQEEFEELGKWVRESTSNQDHKYFLQKFVTRTSPEMIDPNFGKEHLNPKYHETSRELLNQAKSVISKHLPNCEIRGK